MKTLDYVLDYYHDEEIIKADGLDDAIIGIDENTLRLVYSYSKVIEILKREMPEDDAIEWYYFNIQSSHVGGKTPIWVQDFKPSIS